MLGPNAAEARNATVLGLNDVDKQKLEEARQLAMSMTSHPVAFGTIEHTEKAGELLGLLWQEVLRLQCDLKDARDREEKQTLEDAAQRQALAREAHTWRTACRDATGEIERLRAALRQLVDVEDMRLRLRQLHEMGHGTDYTDYHRLLPLAWAVARDALGPNPNSTARPAA